MKYMRDRALRLMLPEPKGTYETVGEKICQELVHFDFAEPRKHGGYSLTSAGEAILRMLNDGSYPEVRRRMALIHLETYSNLRAVVHSHIMRGDFKNPSVDSGRSIDLGYLTELLRPTFGTEAEAEASEILGTLHERSPKKIEDSLRERVLKRLIPEYSIGVPLFRAMTDRLISLRLINAMRVSIETAEFYRTYSPCMEEPPLRKWHREIEAHLETGARYNVYLSEPDFNDRETTDELLHALEAAYVALPEQAGYFDLPDVRDFVCSKLQIPEAAFDEGIVALLLWPKPPVTLGLTYDRISGRRKPLVRMTDATQIYNLIRRA